MTGARLRYKILIVDDREDNRRMFKAILESEGFAVLLAIDAQAALLELADSRPDLILSDVSMPGMDGFALCRFLRADPRTAGIPLILMSAVRQAEKEQAEGLELGADDYLLKPFTARLLVAKVQAVLRRFNAPAELEQLLKAEGLRLDVQARTLSLGGRGVALTRKEFDLLTTFLRKPKRVLSARYLLETVWGYDTADYNDPHTLETHISTLRRKLGPRLAKKIVSVPSLGYRFDHV